MPVNRYKTAMPKSFGSFVTFAPDNLRGLWVKSDEVDALLTRLVNLAGHKDAETACRLVIAECRKALERKP
jgi:hypothetical protein